jgi:hypothetical protein
MLYLLLFLGRDEFIERVMLCQITESNKTAERLFKVLLAGTGEKCKFMINLGLSH